jgi:hypothetical protein
MLAAVSATAKSRVVQLTDWLPPEFSAVSQYALLIGEEEARAGADVTIVGLSSVPRESESRKVGAGSLSIIRVQRDRYDKENWAKRALWSLNTNFLLIQSAWPHLSKSDTIRFTGSPPFLLHCISLANLYLRKRLLYRITDFYPECIIAALKRPNLALEIFRRFTNVLRRRIDAFEVLGQDMKRRLVDCGVSPERIQLRRDNSPVSITSNTQPLPRPPEFADKKVLLYSGNWGVAHDVETVFEAYRRHYAIGSGSVMLWLNATGSGVEEIERRLRSAGLPFLRQRLVPLEQLPRLLITADAHLVTLRPEFMGFVLPSKIYGCIASRKPILFVGPEGSDVHALCSADTDLHYCRIDVGDIGGLEYALDGFI